MSDIDYTVNVSVPVRNRKTKKVFCQVQIYGITKADIESVNTVPYRRALRNCGLDEHEFYISIDDMIKVINGPEKDRWHRYVYHLN